MVENPVTNPVPFLLRHGYTKLLDEGWRVSNTPVSHAVFPSMWHVFWTFELDSMSDYDKWRTKRQNVTELRHWFINDPKREIFCKSPVDIWDNDLNLQRSNRWCFWQHVSEWWWGDRFFFFFSTTAEIIRRTWREALQTVLIWDSKIMGRAFKLKISIKCNFVFFHYNNFKYILTKKIYSGLSKNVLLHKGTIYMSKKGTI